MGDITRQRGSVSESGPIRQPEKGFRSYKIPENLGVRRQDRHCGATMRRDLLAMLDVREAMGLPPERVPEAKRRPTGNRARYQGRDRQHPLRVTVTPAEGVTIKAKAKAAGLSVASYLRAAALDRRVQSVLDHRAVGDLVKVAGDQAGCVTRSGSGSISGCPPS